MSELRSFYDILCGNEPLAFESDFSLHVSVFRLDAEVKSPLVGSRPLTSMRLAAVVGQVAEDRVSIWCERLLIRNTFRPVFVGRFQAFDDRVILIGKMVAMNGMVGYFVGAALAMSLFFIAAASLELIIGSNDPVLWLMPFAGVLPFLFALGMVRAGRWLSSGDEDWLLAAIRSALHK